MNYRRLFLDGHSCYITMGTYRRRPYLIEYIDLLREAFAKSKERYTYAIDAVTVLPDHLHMVITPERSEDYPRIVKQIKRSFVYLLPDGIKEKARLSLSYSLYRRGHSGIRQSRYYEHTIRNEKDWLEKREYIRNNPVKHDLCEHWEEWKYSSFTKPCRPGVPAPDICVVHR